MGLLANFKAKRAAKKAQAIYELEQYNGAMSLNALCVKIMECENDLYWEREE
jgi:hypothetical protein